VNSGRWQQRAAFGELSLHDPARHPVGGPGRQARERWERGGYLLQERGVAEGGYDQKHGVWVSGRWQQRAQWAYEGTCVGRGKTLSVPVRNRTLARVNTELSVAVYVRREMAYVRTAC